MGDREFVLSDGIGWREAYVGSQKRAVITLVPREKTRETPDEYRHLFATLAATDSHHRPNTNVISGKLNEAPCG